MGRPKKTDAFSITQLQSMIAERKGRIGVVRKERAKLLKQLAKVEAELASLGGSLSGGKTGRGVNNKPLPDAIEEVLRANGKPMRVGDIADAVQKAGYVSSSANFRGIVNQALIKDKRFHAPERGLYAAKK
jgi:septal ring factor EnvC (AmiA/AmiB activator)